MGSWIWIAIIVILLVGSVYIAQHRKSGVGKAKSWMGSLFAPSSEILVKRYKALTERETLRAAKLREVLKAKQEFYETKAVGDKLQQEIDQMASQISGDGDKSKNPTKITHRT